MEEMGGRGRAVSSCHGPPEIAENEGKGWGGELSRVNVGCHNMAYIRGVGDVASCREMLGNCSIRGRGGLSRSAGICERLACMREGEGLPRAAGVR